MSATYAPPKPEEPTKLPTRQKRTSTKSKEKPKHQPNYAVVLHNDHLNGMDFVVGALRKVFHYGRLKSLRLMLQAHFTGKVMVWSGTLEVAELKADQLRSCGADPNMKAQGALSLNVSVEPLPGS